MTPDYPSRPTELEPTIADLATIARLRAKHTRYRITFRYVPGGEGMRYTAQAAVLDVHPFAIVTGSLPELAAELEASR